MRSKFAVIGLGSFGSTVAQELQRLGNDVLGIDREERRVSAVADHVAHAVIADVRDERVLDELGLADYDGVIVAIGEDLESNVLCTLALKDLGVRQIWVKALTSSHHRILSRLGVSRIINPEHEVGLHVAQTLTHPTVLDYISLGNGYYVVALDLPDKLDGRRLADLELERRYGIRYLGLKRGSTPDFGNTEVVLRGGDQLLLAGQQESLQRLGRDVL
jgi:trk system potassium uptake protein TrkA